MADSAYINIEALKEKPRLSPVDFATRKEALEYAEARLDALIVQIKELETDMTFVQESQNVEEIRKVATKWQQIAQEARS